MDESTDEKRARLRANYERYRDRNPERFREMKRANAARRRLTESGREYRRAYRDANRDKINAQRRARRVAAPEPSRDFEQQLRQRWWSYHRMRPADMAALLEGQRGRCYLCGDDLPLGEAFIEHDHRCCPKGRSCRFCRRGLSCKKCNSVIGLAYDDPARLRRIAAALEVAVAAVTLRLDARAVQEALFETEDVPVKLIPIPIGLLPSSQEAGGMVHDQSAAMTAPGSPPGFDGGALSYPVTDDTPMPPMFGQDKVVPVSTQPGEKGGAGLPPRKPSGTFDGGQWTGNVTGPGSESGWVKTPAAS
ncbi:MAG: endonuclease VII domain-containing protein [Actinomycetota bacterium]|nr:endonuclease VII domain-containing protein [Actinomycetota bacterium]